jgi:hypothetical protein
MSIVRRYLDAVAGQDWETAESLVFDLDEDGLIAHIAIYIQSPSGGAPPAAPSE